MSQPSINNIPLESRYDDQIKLLESTQKSLLKTSAPSKDIIKTTANGHTTTTTAGNNTVRNINSNSNSFGKIKDSKILMVGAGGIGCELLKNLVLTGFLNIEIVDLDTIDLSNLNRQFLFQKEHIKQSKAKVARLSALQFNPDAQIIAHHDSIFDPKFDLNWYKSFDLVLNALDNLAARRHVNMMCQAANIPMVESGTAGYLGQVTYHQRTVTHCFDCEPKPTPKTFPVCTIRSTPSTPIHCIVWAKSYLFSQLFANINDDNEENNVLDHSENAENSKEIETLNQEALALKLLKESMNKVDYEDLVFQKVFHDDIQRLLTMDSLWKNKTPPIPLNKDQLAKETCPEYSGLERDQTVWSVAVNYNIFKESLYRLKNRLMGMKNTDPSSSLSFDKDDDDALDFVTAAANLRSSVYGIERQSRFKVKEMAGNIIPAIATTNAIIAGIIVIQAIKVLCDLDKSKKDTFIVYDSNKDRFFYSQPYDLPNPQCSACQCTYLHLKLDLNKQTLGQVIDKVIRNNDKWSKYEETLIEEKGRLLYEPDFDDNESEILSQLAIENGSILTVTVDDDQDASLYYVIKLIVQQSDNVKDIKLFGDKTLFGIKRATEPDQPDEEPETKKRKADDDLKVDDQSKKSKLENTVVEIIDGDDDVIELD